MVMSGASKRQLVESRAGANTPLDGGLRTFASVTLGNNANSMVFRHADTSIPGWNGPQPVASTEGAHPFDDISPLSSQMGGVKLSGNAPLFQPAEVVPRKTSRMDVLNSGSTADKDHPLIVRSSITSLNGNVGIIGTGSRSSSSSSTSPKVFFTTDTGPDITFMGSHYIKVSGITHGDFEAAMSYLSQTFNWGMKLRGQKVLPVSPESTHMTLVLCFDDVRDSDEALKEIASEGPANWETTYILQSEYAAVSSLTPYGTQDETSFYDGQVILVAKFKGSLANIKTQGVADKIREIAETYGKVIAIQELAQPGSPDWKFRVEFFKLSAAEKVLEALTEDNAHIFNDWSVTATEIPDPAKANRNNMVAHYVQPTLTYVTPTKQGPAKVFCSPTGRTAWIFDAKGNKVMVPPPTMVQKMITPINDNYGGRYIRNRFNSDPHPQTQVFRIEPRAYSWSGPYTPSSMVPVTDRFLAEFTMPSDQTSSSITVARITHGQDVRTTIMLRNLPGKWGADDVKRRLDHTSFGKYDFSYVRIDFANNSNVGYAFVNFTEAEHIIPFFDEYVGKNWLPGVERRCEVSYATVQGYDCLVEKFRNSAVMDEFEGYRPKLWWTDETAPEPRLVGKERPFPPPNNLSKKQRSHDNAGHIGLYAPRNGWRSGDRARRSQFDRGTTAQIREDAFYAQPQYNEGNYAMHPASYTIAPPPAFPPQLNGNMLNQMTGPFVAPGGYPASPYGITYPTTSMGSPYAAMANTSGGFGMAPDTPAPRGRAPSGNHFAGPPTNANMSPYGLAGPVQTPSTNFFGSPFDATYARMPRTIAEESEDVAPDVPTPNQSDAGGHGYSFGPRQ